MCVEHGGKDGGAAGVGCEVERGVSEGLDEAARIKTAGVLFVGTGGPNVGRYWKVADGAEFVDNGDVGSEDCLDEGEFGEAADWGLDEPFGIWDAGVVEEFVDAFVEQFASAQKGNKGA